MNETLKKAITTGQRSGDYRRAFKDGGGEKECGSWNNALRQYNAAVASSGSAAEAQPQQPKAPPQRQAAAASAAGSAAGVSTGATTATRTGTLQAPNVRATSQQMAKLQARELPPSYAEEKRVCALRTAGTRPVDIAERFDKIDTLVGHV